jgi:hypothetical protein
VSLPPLVTRRRDEVLGMWGGGDLWAMVENQGSAATSVWVRSIGRDIMAVRAWRVSTL